MIFHGLHSLFGNNVVDSKCLWYMYKQYTPPEVKHNLYGKGFTVYSTLDNDDIDRTDIEIKIKSKFYDLIIYGSVHRCRDFLDLIIATYPKNKIAFLDGEDKPTIMSFFPMNNFPYFKRELLAKQNNIFPISFSIPKEKVLTNFTNVTKKKFSAQIIPWDRNTYIYNDEISYYKNYQESYYGITIKKGGWDCLRHYEILANYCMPYFIHLENCPENTMFNFPKKQCIEASHLIESDFFNEGKYYEYLNFMFEYLKNNLTTEKVAIYLIDKLKKL